MNKFPLFFLTLLLFYTSSCNVYKFTSEISETDLSRHLHYLASDSMQGRFPGSRGDEYADAYIKSRFDELKMDNYRQEFSFLRSLTAGPDNFMEINGNALPANSFAPFPFSKDTVVSAPVIMAGYGITIKADTFEWNDYAGLDVKNKWVIVLSGVPDIPGYSDYLSIASEDRDKAMLAHDNGAAGIIMVSGYKQDSVDHVNIAMLKQAGVDMPCFLLLRSAVDPILKMNNTSILDVEALIIRNKKTVGFAISSVIKAGSDIERISGKTGNRYAILEGSDTLKKREYIVIGAHYDHIGMGGQGSPSRAPDTSAVHNGADDNASGISVMLELAAKLKEDQAKTGRSIIFVAFGGEEMGLLGSKYFVNNLPVDLSEVIGMVNIDMVGRLDTARGIQIGGAGTSIEADSLIKLANTSHLKLRITAEGSGPSDHSSFYSKNIPVFFLTTGAHKDYHTPDDDVSGINFKGLQEINEFTYRLAMSIANNPGKLNFQVAGPSEAESTSHRFRVSLGFMPDFSTTDVEGVRVDIVSKGKAAERGGIKNGDVITAIDGLKIKNIYDYMYRLSKLHKNQIISVEIIRNGAKEVLLIQL